MRLKQLFDALNAHSSAAMAEAELQYAAANRVPELEQRLAVVDERLKRSMEREAKLTADLEEVRNANLQLRAESDQLKAAMATMADHPEVQAARKERLRAQIEALKAELGE